MCHTHPTPSNHFYCQFILYINSLTPRNSCANCISTFFFIVFIFIFILASSWFCRCVRWDPRAIGSIQGFRITYEWSEKLPAGTPDTKDWISYIIEIMRWNKKEEKKKRRNVKGENGKEKKRKEKNDSQSSFFILIHYSLNGIFKFLSAQSAGAVEYTNCNPTKQVARI